MPLTPITPISDQGIRRDIAESDAKWYDLKNMVIHHGHLVTRPGSVPVGPTELPDTQAGVPVAIVEIEHPAENYTDIQEVEVPNGTTSNSPAWTLIGAATVHECIDGQDDLATGVSGQDADKFICSIGNPTTTFDHVSGVLIRVRSTNILEGHSQLRLFVYNGATEQDVETYTVYAQWIDNGETDWGTFQDNYFWLPENPHGNVAWTNSALTSLQVGVEAVVDTQVQEYKTYEWPASDGNYTDGGAYTDFVDSTADGASREDGTVMNGVFGAAPRMSLTEWISLQPGEKQSWVLTAPDVTYNTDTINVRPIVPVHTGLFKSILDQRCRFKLFYRESGTDYYLNSGAEYYAGYGGYYRYDDRPVVSVGKSLEAAELLTTNPATSANWTNAQLQAGLEFGIEITGTLGCRVYQPSAICTSTRTTSDEAVAIDHVSVTCCGQITNDESDLPWDRLFLTSNNGYYRMLQEDYNSMEDVSGTVATTTAPYVKPDTAVLFGQIWFANGVDDLYYYPEDNSTFNFAQLSSEPTGRTIASFGDRIMLGDVLETGTRTPQRVRYSDRNDATAWDGATAGYFDLLNTPGHVVKLLPLSEEICVAYKSKGIYNISQTGHDDIPFIPDVVDMEVGCLAHATVKPLIYQGTPVHIFLGQHPSLGVSVFLYDGKSVHNIGEPIRETVLNDYDPNLVDSFFATVDPRDGNYYLFILGSDELYATEAWVYDVEGGQWTRATFPLGVSAAGVWHLQGRNVTGYKRGATTHCILGSEEALPYKLDHDSKWDVISAGYNAYGTYYEQVLDMDNYQTDTDAVTGVNSLIETGDLKLNEPTNQIELKELWLGYFDRGECELTIDISYDAGVTFETLGSKWIGTNNQTGAFRVEKIKLDKYVDQRFRFRIYCNDVNAQFDITEMYIDWIARGQDG